MSEAVNKSDLKQSLEEIDIAVSDPDNEAQEAKPPKRYLILTMLSCFCPSHPINIVAFVFAMMVSEGGGGACRTGRQGGCE